MPYLNDKQASQVLNALKMAQEYVADNSPHHHEDVHMRLAISTMNDAIETIQIPDEQPQILELLCRALQRGDSVERIHAAIVEALK